MDTAFLHLMLTTPHNNTKAFNLKAFIGDNKNNNELLFYSAFQIRHKLLPKMQYHTLCMQTAKMANFDK